MESSLLRKTSPTKRDVVQRLVSSMGQYVPRENKMKPLEPWSPIPKKLISCDEKYKLVQYEMGTFSFKAYENMPAVKLNIQKDSSKLKGDTTGQWVWQAELLLSHQILKSRTLDTIKSVLELGAGSSGYAALSAFLAYNPEKVLITDGNQQNLLTVGKTLEANDWSGKGIQAEQLIWGKTQIKQKYQLILAADCLLFEKHHDSLIQTLKEAMDIDTLTLMVCPSRGGSMQRFLQKAQQKGLKHSIMPLQKNEAERQIELQKLQRSRSNHSRLNRDKENIKTVYDEGRHIFFLIQLRLA